MTDTELELRLTKIEQDIAELKEAYQDLASAVDTTANYDSLISAMQQQMADLAKALSQLQTKVNDDEKTLASHTTTLDDHTTTLDDHTSRITALEEGALSGQFSDGELLLSNFIKESE